MEKKKRGIDKLKEFMNLIAKKRLKISGQFSDAKTTLEVKMAIQDLFKNDQSTKVGDIEGEVYLPIYCFKKDSSKIKKYLTDYGAKKIIVEKC